MPGAPAWLPGTNIMVDVVDPNNNAMYGPNGDVVSAANVALGPLKVGLAFDRGAVTGKTVLAGVPGTPGSLPGFRTWNMGTQGLLTLGLDLGFARLNTLAMSPTATYNQTSLRDKMLGASIDIGSDALSLSAEVLGQSSFAFNDFAAGKASARVGAMNLFDTGIGLGLGMVAGNQMTMPALGAGAAAPTMNLLSGQAQYNSVGVMLKTPSLFVIPSLTLAAQNTMGSLAFSGPAIGSGLSIGTSFQLFGLPTLNAEYSLGKFDAGRDNVLWGSSPWSAEQIAINTNLKF
jgi:hypothetical protein